MGKKLEFKLNEIDGMRYYTIPLFEKTGLVNHIFTTRDINLGFNTLDNDIDILNNFKTICDLLGVKLENSVTSHQVHKSNIRVITSGDKGKGLTRPRDFEEIDGLITDEKGIGLFTFYADCVPMFFLDKKNEVVGVAHGGWRGTLGKIAGNMIDTMINEYNSNPSNILVAIGPSIGGCCFEVNSDVYEMFNEGFENIDDVSKSQGNGKWKLDLKLINKKILESKHVPSENIIVSQMCTNCKSDVFFSYRKEEGKTGRMSAAIALK